MFGGGHEDFRFQAGDWRSGAERTAGDHFIQGWEEAYLDDDKGGCLALLGIVSSSGATGLGQNTLVGLEKLASRDPSVCI